MHERLSQTISPFFEPEVNQQLRKKLQEEVEMYFGNTKAYLIQKLENPASQSVGIDISIVDNHIRRFTVRETSNCQPSLEDCLDYLHTYVRQNEDVSLSRIDGYIAILIMLKKYISGSEQDSFFTKLHIILFWKHFYLSHNDLDLAQSNRRYSLLQEGIYPSWNDPKHCVLARLIIKFLEILSFEKDVLSFKRIKPEQASQDERKLACEKAFTFIQIVWKRDFEIDNVPANKSYNEYKWYKESRDNRNNPILNGSLRKDYLFFLTEEGVDEYYSENEIKSERRYYLEWYESIMANYSRDFNSYHLQDQYLYKTVEREKKLARTTHIEHDRAQQAFSIGQ